MARCVVSRYLQEMRWPAQWSLRRGRRASRPQRGRWWPWPDETAPWRDATRASTRAGQMQAGLADQVRARAGLRRRYWGRRGRTTVTRPEASLNAARAPAAKPRSLRSHYIVSLSFFSRSCISTLIHRRESSFDWGQRPEGASQLQSPWKNTRQRYRATSTWYGGRSPMFRSLLVDA